jgi:tetratricopeptide (TPR) repeat protein
MGLVRNARGLYAEAIPCFERALGIFQNVHGPGFTDCATVLRNMAFSLQKIGDDLSAEKALERAQQIDRG